MRNKDCITKKQRKYKQRLTKHLIVGIIFVIMLFIIKIALIPAFTKSELSYKPVVVIEHTKKNKTLHLKINIQSQNKDLGKASLEVYLDNKLIENNMIYIDKINYTLYTNVAYRNESLLNVILINQKGNKAYFSKTLDFGG
ncbi:hypothetical protein DB313_00780 [Borrelia turcica IST7]|uniref:Uncharacterized protein n=1 Tax=Borrelia turcica IST7 TaxID=1104446 RepID=A0A386PNS4_9SPIR|nr:hypothetical protein [Borrelia turcica]AYE36719.1 hypothetical protein DB313_00780 [Borrelia turcica IST7]